MLYFVFMINDCIITCSVFVSSHCQIKVLSILTEYIFVSLKFSRNIVVAYYVISQTFCGHDPLQFKLQSLLESEAVSNFHVRSDIARKMHAT
jgi:hypothetical protein